MPPERGRDLAYVLATWFGCGHVPRAPGTAGTLGALPLYFALQRGGAVAVACGALLLLPLAIWSASRTAARLGVKDPQIIVIDEVVGVLLTLVVARSAWQVVAAVVLFRIYDQYKPWPARWAERSLPGGLGIVLDDVFAGLWGALSLLLWQRMMVRA